jgi:hypothetical protein
VCGSGLGDLSIGIVLHRYRGRPGPSEVPQAPPRAPVHRWWAWAGRTPPSDDALIHIEWPTTRYEHAYQPYRAGRQPLTPCKTCEHENRREIERQQKAGVPDSLLAEATRAMGGGYVSRLALGRHRREHLGVDARPGRRPMSGDFARDVELAAAERLASGELRPSLRDGLNAAALIARRDDARLDRDILARIALALTANVRVLDPEVEALEAEYRPLLTAGDQ